MFLEHREKEENKRQATAGYDLTDAYAQISYCLPGEPCPKTISLQADQEQYLIPALLGRYTDQDLWVYGPKAQAAAAAGEVFLVDGLLTKAAHQEMVEVGGQNYSSVALLSLFLKRTMSLPAADRTPGTPAGARLFCAGSVCTHIVGGDGCGRHARSEKCESVSDRTRGEFFLLQYLPTRRTLETGCASV